MYIESSIYDSDENIISGDKLMVDFRFYYIFLLFTITFFEILNSSFLILLIIIIACI